MTKTTKTPNKSLAIALMTGSALALCAGNAHAQDVAEADTADSDDDVIVVTARLREETVQDVPISITAISGDELRDQNAFSLEDIAQSTPGLVYQDTGSLAAPTIRGLAQTDQTAFVGNVGVFIDGVFLNSRSLS